MPFVRDDEYIIYMDTFNCVKELLPLEDIQELREAGIRTALLTGMDWNEWQEHPDYFDRQLDRFRRAGMKVLLPLWTYQSNSLDTSWYSVDANKSQHGPTQINGRREKILSPWNGLAQDRYNSTLRDVKAKYEGSGCQVISYGFRYGESVMPSEPRYFDAAGQRAISRLGTKPTLDWMRETYTAMLVEQQRILVDSPWSEVWYCLHYGKAHQDNTGCQWIDDYLAEWTKLQPKQINHITYSYFPYPKLEDPIRRERERWNVNEWVGAEYCEGLAENTPKAISQGLRGFILSPCHYMTRQRRINIKMLREIDKALNLWVAAGRH